MQHSAAPCSVSALRWSPAPLRSPRRPQNSSIEWSRGGDAVLLVVRREQLAKAEEDTLTLATESSLLVLNDGAQISLLGLARRSRRKLQSASRADLHALAAVNAGFFVHCGRSHTFLFQGIYGARLYRRTRVILGTTFGNYGNGHCILLHAQLPMSDGR